METKKRFTDKYHHSNNGNVKTSRKPEPTFKKFGSVMNGFRNNNTDMNTISASKMLAPSIYLA